MMNLTLPNHDDWIIDSDYFNFTDNFNDINDTTLDDPSLEFNISIYFDELCKKFTCTDKKPETPTPFNTFKFITVGIMLSTISVFGLVGNIVAIVVLSRPTMKGSFSSLLIGKIFGVIPK